MIRIRRSEDRGRADHGWLDTRHTFSFADYDPLHMGYGALRVINDDRVAAGYGFPTHTHRDMEIVSYVVAGALEHRDSLGNGSVIRPGDVQRMSAGRGVAHSEFNPSKDEPTRFLQIWIVPERAGLDPGYEQKRFAENERRGQLRVVASRDGRDGSVTVHQDVAIHAGLLDAGERAQVEIAPGRRVWVQVVRGEVEVLGERLREGDGAAVENERRIAVEGLADAEILVFDLA